MLIIILDANLVAELEFAKVFVNWLKVTDDLQRNKKYGVKSKAKYHRQKTISTWIHKAFSNSQVKNKTADIGI